ncbi:MAG TPA: response regulator transcription factor [Burkholderiales bacterium]|nr:response regulator transcription factor [Burkholderiales bacterium]
MNLLVVDGEAMMRARLRAYLELILPSCRVLEAWNGAHALALCASERPELVLVDIGLPDTNGIALTARLRALSPAPAVIVISYHDGEDYAARARAAGACTYLVKNRLASELAPALARALGIRPRSASTPGSESSGPA